MQSVTDQPCRPWPQRRAHALLGGGDEGRRQVAPLDAGRELDPVPDRCRLDAQPDPGQVGVAARAHPVHRRARARPPAPGTPPRCPRSARGRRTAPPAAPPTTSFCTSPCRLTAASPSVSSSRRSISGSSSASSVRPAKSAVRWVGSSGSTSACRVAGGKRCVRRRGGRPNECRRSGPPARAPPRSARRARPGPTSSPPGPLTASSVTRCGRAPPTATRSRTRTSPDHSRTQARRPRSSRSTAKTVPAAGPLGRSADGRGRSSAEHAPQLRRARAGDRRPAQHRRQVGRAARRGGARAPRPGRRRLAVHPSREQPVVGLRDGCDDRLVVRASAGDRGVAARPGRGRGPARRRAGSAAGVSARRPGRRPRPPGRPCSRTSRSGTPIRCSARQITTVCGWTPSTDDSTSTAASSTTRERSTSAMKSGWPGGVDEVDVEVAAARTT